MKKTFAFVLVLVLALTLFSCGDKPEQADDTVIRVAVLNGTTGFGIAPLYTSVKSGETASYASIDFYASADLISPLIINGSIDIAAVPTNLAAVLYNKTKGAVDVLAVNTLGVLYLVENGETVKTLNDLKGKTVYLPGQNSNPEFVLRTLLQLAGIIDEVTLDYTYGSPDELTTALASGTVSLGVLPEPKVTAAMTKNTSLRAALDFTQIWKTATGTELVQGCLIVRSEFAQAHDGLVEQFLKDYEKSVNKVNEDPAAAADMIVSAGLAANTALVTNALPRCNITYLTGDGMKASLNGFWSALYNILPASVGGALPDDGIFN